MQKCVYRSAQCVGGVTSYITAGSLISDSNPKRDFSACISDLVLFEFAVSWPTMYMHTIYTYFTITVYLSEDFSYFFSDAEGLKLVNIVFSHQTNTYVTFLSYTNIRQRAKNCTNPTCLPCSSSTSTCFSVWQRCSQTAMLRPAGRQLCRPAPTTSGLAPRLCPHSRAWCPPPNRQEPPHICFQSASSFNVNFKKWSKTCFRTSSTCACVCCRRLLLVRLGVGWPPSPSGAPGVPADSRVDLQHEL